MSSMERALSIVNEFGVPVERLVELLTEGLTLQKEGDVAGQNVLWDQMSDEEKEAFRAAASKSEVVAALLEIKEQGQMPTIALPATPTPPEDPESQTAKGPQLVDDEDEQSQAPPKTDRENEQAAAIQQKVLAEVNRLKALRLMPLVVSVCKGLPFEVDDDLRSEAAETAIGWEEHDKAGIAHWIAQQRIRQILHDQGRSCDREQIRAMAKTVLEGIETEAGKIEQIDPETVVRHMYNRSGTTHSLGDQLKKGDD